MFDARPPAKLNLTLEVGPRAANGYHPLRSIFLRIGLADSLSVAPATGARDRLEIGGLPGCPVDGNLVLAAFEVLRRASGAPLPALAARLEKHIPIGAGLAGGSSDAAAALDLAAACWGLGLAPGQRERLALELGSDVPFFAAGCAAALVEGRGERVTQLPGPTDEVGALLAVTAHALPTGAVFARFDARAAARREPEARPRLGGSATDALAGALRSGLDGEALVAWLDRLAEANDLLPAAADLAGGLAGARSELERASGRRWLLTGSGPTLFTLYPSPQQAHAAGRRLARRAAIGQLGYSLLATGTGLAGQDGRQ